MQRRGVLVLAGLLIGLVVLLKFSLSAPRTMPEPESGSPASDELGGTAPVSQERLDRRGTKTIPTESETDESLQHLATLSVRLTKDGREPIEGRLVRLYSPSDLRRREARTSPSGLVRFEALAADRYFVESLPTPAPANRAHGASLITQTPGSDLTLGPHEIACSTSVLLLEGEERLLELAPIPGATVSGIVRRHGIGVPGATVVLSSGARVADGFPTVRTDALGRFTIRGVPPGSVQLSVRDSPVGLPLRIEAISGQHHDVELGMGSGTWRARVVEPMVLSPINGCTVDAIFEPADGSAPHRMRWRTGQDGLTPEFDFGEGRLTITARPGAVSEYSPSTVIREMPAGGSGVLDVVLTPGRSWRPPLGELTRLDVEAQPLEPIVSAFFSGPDDSILLPCIVGEGIDGSQIIEQIPDRKGTLLVAWKSGRARAYEVLAGDPVFVLHEEERCLADVFVVGTSALGGCVQGIYPIAIADEQGLTVPIHLTDVRIQTRRVGEDDFIEPEWIARLAPGRYFVMLKEVNFGRIVETTIEVVENAPKQIFSASFGE